MGDCMRIPASFFLLCWSVFGGREVAITIDDLPRGGDRLSSPAETLRMTEKLMTPFQAGHIPVTGFVNECRKPEDLRKILSVWLRAGAELGNHTCSHLDLNTTPVAGYQADIVKGEPVTTALLGRRPSYFRHPFLHTGKDAATRAAVENFLSARGYRIAPVTLDNADYMFAAVYASALVRGDETLAARSRESYLSYMESIFEFFEKRSEAVAGHEIRQVLLIHASQLNADTMPRLLEMMKRRGYRFVSLDRALEDDAYSLPDAYAGTGGFSWIHRWSITKGMPGKGEPDQPGWITQEWKRLNRN